MPRVGYDGADDGGDGSDAQGGGGRRSRASEGSAAVTRMSTRWWIGVTVSGAVSLGAIGVFSPMLSGPINDAVVTATFVAVLWYAVETRRLVRGQERTAKISRHPWLEATNLKPEVIQPSHEIPLSGYHIWLPITNVGDTPAVILARFFSFWS